MSPRIVRVLAPNPSVYTLDGTNTWIVGSDPAAVIDPGPDIREHLEEVRRAAGRIAMILLTHQHEDHASGAPALSRMTDAPILAYRNRGALGLQDGQQLTLASTTLVAIHAPGHTRDSTAIYEPDSRSLFAGDTVLGRGTSFLDPPEGDLAAYLRSLRRLKALAARAIYPGHGPAVFRVAGKLDEYLTHRAERERQVLAALNEQEERSPEDLVPEIYAGYPEDTWPLAARSVLAHLLKLEADGRVRRLDPEEAPRFVLSETHPCARCGRPVRGRSRLCERCSLEVLQESPSMAPSKEDAATGTDAPAPEPGARRAAKPSHD
ncbi:MAG: MBL fold metallo-hydrolase [Actinomycetota bacterium]|nr:MBL fold metallo-hydrolase [Actinomycetota bacterium]